MKYTDEQRIEKIASYTNLFKRIVSRDLWVMKEDRLIMKH